MAASGLRDETLTYSLMWCLWRLCCLCPSSFFFASLLLASPHMTRLLVWFHAHHLSLHLFPSCLFHLALALSTSFTSPPSAAPCHCFSATLTSTQTLTSSCLPPFSTYYCAVLWFTVSECMSSIYIPGMPPSTRDMQAFWLYRCVNNINHSLSDRQAKMMRMCMCKQCSYCLPKSRK